MARLQWLRDKPPGILFAQQSDLDVVVVDKVESQLRLWLFRPGSKLVQSRLDLTDPLHLISPYSQAALMGLAWKSKPKRVYVIGLGGGRLPLVLHHYLPDLIVETTEIDPLVIEVATKFFGVQADARLIVANQDGREYLAQREPDLTYDLIFNDAFSSGGGPFHLATQDFYHLCQRRLSQGGAVIVNLLQNDPLLAEKIKTIQTVFAHICLWPLGWGNRLIIGSHSPPLEQADLIECAQAIQDYHQFSFSLVNRAREVKIGPALAEYLPDSNQIAILVDRAEP